MTRVALVDVIAASVCQLANWRGGPNIAFIERAERVMHPGRCRFCAMSSDERLAISRRLAEVDDRQRAEWARLSSAARLARIREAQQEGWLEALEAGQVEAG